MTRGFFRAEDAYSGHILGAVGSPAMVRVAFGHYNALEEVDGLLEALADLIRPKVGD